MENKELELEQYNIIVKIPVDAIKVSITAKMLNDKDEIVSVCNDMNMKDIYEARTAFLENVEDGDDFDARYVLTEKGKAYLDALRSDCNVEGYSRI